MVNQCIKTNKLIAAAFQLVDSVMILRGAAFLSWLLSCAVAGAMEVAFTIEGKKYSLEVDPESNNVESVLAEFCQQHLQDIGLGSGNVEDCSAALLPSIQQVVENNLQDPHYKAPNNVEDSNSNEMETHEEIITAEIGIGDQVYSIPFRPSVEAVELESRKFCIEHAKMFGIDPLVPASLANCQQPVASALQQAWTENMQEALFEDERLHDDWEL